MASALFVRSSSTVGLSDSICRQLIEQSLVGMLAVEDQEIVYANQKCAEIFARPLEQLIGTSVDEVLPPSLRNVDADRFRHWIAGWDISPLFPVRGVRPDGSVRDLDVQTSVVHTSDWRAVTVMSILDVTERNLRVDRALDSLADDWRGTFDAVHTPIVITQRNGAVVRMNRAASELAGRPEKEVIGRSVGDVGVNEPWRMAAQMVKYISDERSGTSTETRDDAGRTWDINISYFSEAGDHSERYILVFWNITGTVELQESLRRSETMSAMGKIVAGVAHEVRNPLFGISATLDAFAEELSQPGYQECAAALNTEVKRLTSLMQDLLEFGKPSALHIELGNLHDVVAEVIDHHAQSGIALENAVPRELPQSLMDRGRMRQVFENLIANAEQHAPEGSVVRVIGSVLEYGSRQWIECRVEDTGPGFNPEDLDRVFDPFFTRREGGTGLGLSIVERIIHDHSGRVTAGNRPDGGAIVRILLPLAELD